MRVPWWHPVWDLTRHALVYATSLALLALSAIYGSAITLLVSQFSGPKFVVHVLNFLEYAAVVVDALLILAYLIQHLRRSFKRMPQ
jgi:hypothetical protein